MHHAGACFSKWFLSWGLSSEFVAAETSCFSKLVSTSFNVTLLLLLFTNTVQLQIGRMRTDLITN